MSNADKKIKHFVLINFFNWQNRNYPYDVLDVNFLSKQLILAKNNALKSLENQTNKNFEICFRMHRKHFSDKKYEFILSTLMDSTTLPIKLLLDEEIRRLVEDAYNQYDFVITSRMDLDDFIYKDAVADTQNKINECEKILSYGYCKGYTYVYGELYPHYKSWGGIGQLAILQSLIVQSSFIKKIPFVYVLSFYHHIIKRKMKEFLEENHVSFAESMFQQNLSTNAYIYFRHEFSQDQLTLNLGNPTLKIPKHLPLTNMDITKEQLKAEFAFEYELGSIK